MCCWLFSVGGADTTRVVLWLTPLKDSSGRENEKGREKGKKRDVNGGGGMHDGSLTVSVVMVDRSDVRGGLG